MNIEQASTFLTNSILIMLALVIIICCIIFINNLLHKYWKPVKIFTADSWVAFNPPHRFTHHEELEKITPHLDENRGKEKTS